ncbi:MAG: efflux RND transporter permease subunit [Clostridia bacterium]|jgi:HAE1 family hydrophobic/amphiphilic exporter-1|nr:efflux RND transporter permease subunit [Clostridia bacterium]
MKLTDLSVRRPVTIAMIFLMVILLGVVSLNKLNPDLFPELDLPMALVMTSYQNVGPEEIENLITRPLEGTIGTVNGLKNIQSLSQQGSSLIFVEFAWGTDMNFAVTQMRDKIELISTYFPSEADKPMIIKMDPNMMPLMVMGISGDSDLATLDKIATDVIQPGLEKVEGVASVSISGGVKREIRISAIPQRLQAYGVSLEQIINQLRLENRNASVGSIEEGLKEQMLRVVGEFSSVQDIEDMQIPLTTGGYVRLAELARVEDTVKDNNQFVYMNGEPCIQVAIQKQTDANTVRVSEGVKEALAKLQQDLPQNLKVNVAMDQADYIRLSLDQVKSNALSGAALAILILFLFLRNIRSTLIIGTAIPISILATFTLLYLGGLTLNIITLGGLALGVGMMVDNAIVVLENIYRYRQEGHSRSEAAKKATDEIGLAVTASTLTTIVVFVPIVYVEGLASQVFRPMALTVAFALLASLFVAITLVPMLSSKILKVESREAKRGFFSKIFQGWSRLLVGLDQLYRRVLAWAIRHRKTVVVSTLLLFIVSIAVIPFVGMEFMPKQDTGQYSVNITLPNGTAVQETERVTKLVQKYIEELPEHEWAIYAIGVSGDMISTGGTTEKATISGKLKDKSERVRHIDQVMDELRVKCAGIPGAEIEIASMDVMTTGQQSISIGLSGDNLEVLKIFAETVAERVRSIEGTREVTTSFEEGRPEIHLKLQREKAEQYGISTTQLSSLLATAISGTTATQYHEGGEEIDVRVVIDQEYSKNINNLESLMVASPTGALVPLRDVAVIETVKGPTQIIRDNQSRWVSVTGEISGRPLNVVMQDIQTVLSDLPIPAGVQLEFGGANKEMIEAFQDLSLALILAIILVYMVLASQFEGLLYPFIIMFSIPPTLIGVVFSLLFTGRTLNITSFIGIIMLAGIVVNNAIVLVDYINTLRRRDGMLREEAILKAGPTRLRPILMTSLTTILALIPLCLGIGEGAELSAPMATVVAGGLAFSTLITLVLVPCMYIIMDNFSLKVKRLFFGKPKSSMSESIK